MSTLFIFKTKALKLSKWSYGSPPIMLIIEFRKKHVGQSLMNMCIFGVHFSIHIQPHIIQF
jgi:hypothetical protein